MKCFGLFRFFLKCFFEGGFDPGNHVLEEPRLGNYYYFFLLAPS